MSFYEGLRDETAGPLIAQFGQAGVYRIYGSETYNNVTGKTTPGAATDTPIQLLDLPMSDRDFTEDVRKESNVKVLVAAKELAAAGVTPEVDAEIIFAGDTRRILSINTVGPSGVPVIYKMAVV